MGKWATQTDHPEVIVEDDFEGNKTKSGKTSLLKCPKNRSQPRKY